MRAAELESPASTGAGSWGRPRWRGTAWVRSYRTRCGWPGRCRAGRGPSPHRRARRARATCARSPLARARGQLGQRVGENAAPDRIRGVVRGRATNELLHLLEAALVAAKKVQLEPVRDCYRPAWSPLAEGARLSNELLGLSEPPLEQCHGCFVRANEPLLRRLAELRGQRLHRLEVCAGRREVAEFDRVLEVGLIALDSALEVTRLNGHVDQLLRERDQLGRKVRREVAVRVPNQGVG